MRDKADMMSSQARTANLTNLFDSVGDIGRESYARNMIMSNPALYYTLDSDGYVTYKNSDVERYAKANGLTYEEALPIFQQDSKRHNMNVKSK